MQSGRAVCRRPARRTDDRRCRLRSAMPIAIGLVVRQDQRRTLEGLLGLAAAFDPLFFDIPNHRCGAGALPSAIPVGRLRPQGAMALLTGHRAGTSRGLWPAAGFAVTFRTADNRMAGESHALCQPSPLQY